MRISSSFSSFSGAPFTATGPSTEVVVSVSDAHFAVACAVSTAFAQVFAPWSVSAELTASAFLLTPALAPVFSPVFERSRDGEPERGGPEDKDEDKEFENEVDDDGPGKEERFEEERLLCDLGRVLPRGVVSGGWGCSIGYADLACSSYTAI